MRNRLLVRLLEIEDLDGGGRYEFEVCRIGPWHSSEVLQGLLKADT